METIHTLLNIDTRALQEFSLQANIINNAQNQRVVDKALTRLRRVEMSAIQSAKPIKITQQTLDDIVRKAKRCAASNEDEEILSTRELRILSYNMSEFQTDDTTFDYVLRTLEEKWRNLYFNGLIFHVMNMWNNIDQNKRIKICLLIRGKLQAYTDNNRRYIELKNHSNLFDEAGPIRLAALVKAKNVSLIEAPTLMGCKASTFGQSYYDDVIINYYEHQTNATLDEMERVLEMHNSSKTKKMVLANLILKENQANDVLRQSIVASLAQRILGDLSLIQTWAPFYGATQAEKEKLYQACEIVNTWYTRRTIETFFDVCVQDPSRKQFWLRYVKYVDDGFKIAGSSIVKASLAGDNRVSNLLPRIFILTKSKTSRTAALILYIRNKVFVEFTDLGSLYVYHPTQYEIKGLDKRRYIESINDLKDTSIGQLVSPNGYGGYIHYDYGVMRHAGYWQSRLASWMGSKIIPLPPAPITMPETEKQEIRSNPTILEDIDLKECLVSSRATEKETANGTSRISLQINTQNNRNTPNLYIKSKHIFDGKCQIAWGEQGFYLYVVQNGHCKLIHAKRYYHKPIGQIWIRKMTSDGFLPIVFHTQQEDYSVGKVKMLGNTIFYKSDMGLTVSFKLWEI